MTRRGSLVGEKFGLLTVVSKNEEESTKHATKYDCICDCGNATIVMAAKLNNGHTKSCGCLRKQSPANKTHGLRNTPTFACWANMKNRCEKDYIQNFDNYKARGISYDPRWENFINFLQDMGEAPEGMSLDRIDVNGNYCKENCRWVDRSMQMHNRRKMKMRNENTYSEYVGVSWSETSRKFVSKLVKNGKVVHREYFDSEYEAAVAYDNISEVYLGDRPNNTKVNQDATE